MLFGSFDISLQRCFEVTGVSSKQQGVGLFSKLLVAMYPVSTRLLAVLRDVRICRECFQFLPVSCGNLPETSGRPGKVYDFDPGQANNLALPQTDILQTFFD